MKIKIPKKNLSGIKLKNILLILLGISLFTDLAGVLFYIAALIIFVAGMLTKIIGAILIGYNFYHIFIQIKNDDNED